MIAPCATRGRLISRITAGTIAALGAAVPLPTASVEASDRTLHQPQGLAPNQLAQRVEFYCQPPDADQVYLEAERLADLRIRFAASPPDHLEDLDRISRLTLRIAFDVGPDGGFYATRLLRTFSILEAMAEHRDCLATGGECPVAAEIRHFETGARKPADWTDLYRKWKGFLVQDAVKASMCLAM